MLCVGEFIKFIRRFSLNINKEKTKLINIKKDGLIYLNRIIIENGKDEFDFLKEYTDANNNLKVKKDFLHFINLDKKNYNNIIELKRQQKLEIEQYNEKVLKK